MTSSVNPVGGPQDQEATILPQLKQYGITPTGNFADDLKALQSAQSNQSSSTQKTHHHGNKANFEAEVQAYMSSHEGVTEEQAKEAVKAQHASQHSQLTQQLPTENLWK